VTSLKLATFEEMPEQAFTYTNEQIQSGNGGFLIQGSGDRRNLWSLLTLESMEYFVVKSRLHGKVMTAVAGETSVRLRDQGPML
jgi:hypothetical protein